MTYLGATLAAMICAWLADGVLESLAPLWARLLIGFVVSTVAYYRALQFLRELKGR